MDDQKAFVAATLRPVIEEAMQLDREFDSLEEAAKAARQVEVAAVLAAELLARQWNKVGQDSS